MNRNRLRRDAVTLLAITGALAGRAAAAPLDPTAYTSLGTLNAAAGSYTATTDGAQPLMIIGGTLYSGIVVSQGAGLPSIAVFDFDNVTFAEGSNLRATGSRPIAILSRGNLTLAATSKIDVSLGGAGGGLGTAGADGGPGSGGDYIPNSYGFAGGLGGGFGGQGGFSALAFYGGPSYGNLTAALQAGSAGGRGYFAVSGTTMTADGGAGGGALELGAVGNVSIASAIIDARGAPGTSVSYTAGGGGSGGGVYLHGATVDLSSGAIQAAGGDGGAPTQSGGVSGGGGGGGRIVLQPATYTAGTPISLVSNVAGGNAPGVSSTAGFTGVAQLAPLTTIVPSGNLFTFAAPAGLNDFYVTNLTVQTGGVVARSASYVNPGTVKIAAGATFTCGGTVTGGTFTMTGGTLVAAGGVSIANGTSFNGGGTVVGPISSSGTSPGSISAGGGFVLSIGDANRTDGVNFDGTLNAGLNNQPPATLILNDSDGAVIGNTIISTGSTLRSSNGIRLPAGRQLTAATSGSCSVGGAFTNLGIVNGPTQLGRSLTFTDDVDGSGSFTGNVIFSDGLAPGTSATIATINAGAVTLDASSTTSIDLIGSDAGNGFDRLQASGAVIVHGALTLNRGPNYVPRYGVTHRIISGSSVAGVFNSITGVVVSADRSLAVTYTATGVDVTAALPGDADLNRTVDFNDLLALARDYSQTGQTWAGGDFDGNGAVNFDDLLALARHFNGSVAVGATDATASLPIEIAADWLLARSLVPEPATLAAALAATGVFVRRRRG